jgi:hypothetical protein
MAPQPDPRLQQFLARFPREWPPDNEWEVFHSSDGGHPVNVHWHHILNHTYRHMWTTDSKPGHSLFPFGTSARQVGTYIQEAIDRFYQHPNPTLSCGTVTVGWDQKNGIPSMVTFFRSLPEGHADRLGRAELDLLQEHLHFD